VQNVPKFADQKMVHQWDGELDWPWKNLLQRRSEKLAVNWKVE
jgi:hypothetical protein